MVKEFSAIHYKPENPFQQKIAEIARTVAKEELEPMIEKICDERMEKILEEQVPLFIASELHRILNGGELKQGPGGRRMQGRKAGGKKRKKIEPRPRCEEHGCAKNKTEDGEGWECRKCAE